MLHEPALVCSGVTKRFDATVALDGLDLVVGRRRRTALLGPSGCGKTTALRVIAGLERPDRGEVRLHDRVVASPTMFVPPERRRVGMVFQDYALFPHLTVERNVAYGLRHLHARERRRRVVEALDLVGLGGFGRRLPHELSGGQRQRVALARALAPRPRVVLLDEPFSNLDAGLRVAIRTEVRDILARAEATALLVTHDQEEALSFADEVAVMRDGRLHQVAAPERLYREPATRFVAEFVGDVDVLPARRIDRHAVETSLGRLRTLGEVTADRGAAMVRPEALRLLADGRRNALVEGVSFFGHDQLIHLRLDDGTRVRSRQGPDILVGAGDRVHAEVDGEVVVFGEE